VFKAGFIIEQTLGHVTHGQNLRRLLANEPDLETRWLEVPFRPRQALYRVFPVSANWSLRGSLYARRELMADDWRKIDAAFLHTPTIGLLAAPFLNSVPTVISTDATPVNIDSLSSGYRHRRQPELVERLKLAVTSKALSHARAFVTWSEWAKASLVSDYGVAADSVLVVPPGTDVELFRKPQKERRPGPPRILFVGGDFRRKGGDTLLEAFRRRLSHKAELHLVTTGHDLPPEDGVSLYRGLAPNSEALLELFHDADLFALPTRADCLAVVLGEAMAASLPVVTTTVGAHPEAVADGHEGYIVPPDDVEALADALERLVDDPALRLRMGQEARAAAVERFDAHSNALKILDLMRSIA